MYAALMISSLDLCEVHLLVSATGWAVSCASLVFDLCLCAEEKGSSFYRTTVAWVPGVKARFRAAWMALGKLSSHPGPCLAHLCSGAGGTCGGFQRDDQAQLWDEVRYTVGTRWPVLTAALDLVFPALFLASSCVFSFMQLPGYLCQDASPERPSSLLLLTCDNLTQPLSHLSKKEPPFNI